MQAQGHYLTHTSTRSSHFPRVYNVTTLATTADRFKGRLLPHINESVSLDFFVYLGQS